MVLGSVVVLVVLGLVTSGVTAPMNLLDIILLLPLAGFSWPCCLPKSSRQLIRTLCAGFALLTFAGGLALATHYHAGPSPIFVTDIVWVLNPEIHYHVGRWHRAVDDRPLDVPHAACDLGVLEFYREDA